MKELTRKEKAANIKLALIKWLEVPPEKVVRDLRKWRGPPHDCGAAACFGGHLTTWPEFQAMGVKTSHTSYAPWLGDGLTQPGALVEQQLLYGVEVAEHLFGFGGLFEGRYGGSDTTVMDLTIFDIAGTDKISDHELVRRRLVLALYALGDAA